MEKKLKKLSREDLSEIILNLSELLSKEQYQTLETMIEDHAAENVRTQKAPVAARMSQEFVDEKMEQIKHWMEQIDEGELYLDVREYEDYSEGYWDREWVTEYDDHQGIEEKILSVIRFAKDCVEDRRYEEANVIYEWLWDMVVSTRNECYDEYDSEPADLEELAENGVIHTDMKQLALLTLYADYQVQKAEDRAEDMYLYFTHFTFQNLHIEEMFHAGREDLTGTEQFWQDWIELLKTKGGDVEGRLLHEAVLYHEGAQGLLRLADENSQTHPSLYLAAMEECEKTYAYEKMEEIGERAMEKLDSHLIIRSETALRAAYASSCLSHTEKMTRFCWEGFRSDSTIRNFLRLFGAKEMADQYAMRGKEVLAARVKRESTGFIRNRELRRNTIEDHTYYSLLFYMGDLQAVRQASKNPQGSLGWSGSFIRYGIRLFLLYLYEKPLPSKAAETIACEVGFTDSPDSNYTMKFENEIIEESRQQKISIFWNYFKRWKPYFQMEQKEREQYLNWAEKVVYSRADAIVGGQHRNHYAEVAALLAMVAEIKEDMGAKGAMREVFAEYKRKFPRHSSFQAEMKKFFGQ